MITNINKFNKIIQIFIGAILLILQIIIYNSKNLFEMNDNLFVTIVNSINVFCLILMLIIIVSVYKVFRNKSESAIVLIIQCIGAIISMMRYRYWISHFDGDEVYGWFILIPYIICIVISIFVYFLISILKKNKKSNV